jgi:tight adherence protein C
MEFLININNLLVEKIGPLGPLVVVGGLGLLLVLLTLPVLLKKRYDPMDKFRDASGYTPKSAVKAPKDDKRTLRFGAKNDKLDKFASFLEPQKAEELTAAKLKMLQAGYKSKDAVRTFHAAQFILGITALILGVAYTILTNNGEPMSPVKLAINVIGPAGIGYYLPKYWVERRRQTRQQEIMDGFPDALDMMLVCVEAGQSLDQSIIRVSREIRAGFPALADEYEMVAHEIKAGKDRTTVLRDMSERAGVPDVSSFVTVLIQSATFGTSIADALRVYASEMRDKRVMRAEEKANKLPTKLTLCTMMFTVPPLLLIMIGPSIYEISNVLSKMTGI